MNRASRQTMRKGRGGSTTRSQQRDKAIDSMRKRRAHTRKPSQARKIGRRVEAGEATKKTANNVPRQVTDLSMNRVRHRRNGQTGSKEVTTRTAGPGGEGARKGQKQKEERSKPRQRKERNTRRRSGLRRRRRETPEGPVEAPRNKEAEEEVGKTLSRKRKRRSHQ